MKLYTPTVGELIGALSKFNRDDKIWFDALVPRLTPIEHIDGGSYTVHLSEGSYANTVHIELNRR